MEFTQVYTRNEQKLFGRLRPCKVCDSAVCDKIWVILKICNHMSTFSTSIYVVFLTTVVHKINEIVIYAIPNSLKAPCTIKF